MSASSIDGRLTAHALRRLRVLRVAVVATALMVIGVLVAIGESPAWKQTPPAPTALALSAVRPVLTVSSPVDVPREVAPHTGRAEPLHPTALPSVVTRSANQSVPRPRAAPPAHDHREALGRELFLRRWLPNDPRSHGGDGLGPVYNADSCVACHGQPAPGGSGKLAMNVDLLTAPTRPVVLDFVVNESGQWRAAGTISQEWWSRLHPGFKTSKSVLLHRFGVDAAYAQFRSMILRTAYHPRMVARGVSAHSQRNAPALFGAGRIDALADDVLIRAASTRHPGVESVHGRVHQLQDGRIGRFGWKAQIASLEEFVLTACANELGLEVPGRPQAASPLKPEVRASSIDMSVAECEALVAYVRRLPPPGTRALSSGSAPADVESGRRLFAKVGCTACHIPDLGPVRGIYSDLLLHDMGWALTDGGSYYDELASPDNGSQGRSIPVAPRPAEWRTPPLWGFRDSAPYLHDGRAVNLDEAVTLHGGESAAVAVAFLDLADHQRAQIEAFLNSLAAAEASGACAPNPVSPEPRAGSPADFYVQKGQHDRHATIAGDRAQILRLYGNAAHLHTRLLAARNLEKMGKTQAALRYYDALIREHPDSEYGRQAAAAIKALRHK